MYRVKYTDPDGNSPTIRVHIDGDAGHAMSQYSGAISTGMIYTYTTTRARGSHQYHFEASDGTASIRLLPSGEFSGPTVSNSAPVACFNTSPNGLTVTATSCSTDADGDGLTYSWNWGDSATGSGNPASHTYACPGGTWTITMTVSDGQGGSAPTTRSVSPADFDNDADGLKNCQETGTYETNPNVADTDGDGRNDGTELTSWNSFGPNAWNTNYDRLSTATNNLLKWDADADGIKDGYEFSVPGSIFGPNAPASTAGCSEVGGRNECPDPRIRDLYVQLNWLPASNCFFGTCLTPSDGPSASDIAAFRANFDNWNNAAGRPDNEKVRLHLYVGSSGNGAGAVGTHTNQIRFGRTASTTGAWDDFYDYKDAAFPSSRLGYFHLYLFAHDVLDDSGVVQAGMGEVFGNDAVASKNQLPSATDVLGVFMHELGHNLLGEYRSLPCYSSWWHNPEAWNLLNRNDGRTGSYDDGNNASGVCYVPDGIQDVYTHTARLDDAIGFNYGSNRYTTYSTDGWLALKPAKAILLVRPDGSVDNAPPQEGLTEAVMKYLDRLHEGDGATPVETDLPVHAHEELGHHH